MLQISASAVAARLRLDNPWWDGPYADATDGWPRRAHYESFAALLRRPVQRAVVLLGARRVGKTTLLRQAIQDAHRRGDLGPVLFASVDAPVYSSLSLEDLLRLFDDLHPHDPRGPRLVVFDEIQYLRDWERHLKDLVDRFPRTRFVASGSAGAALKRKSNESGAGRFTDFELPPLTFAEFLDFRGVAANVMVGDRAIDLGRLNELFVEYVNVGGYPEVVRNEAVARDLERFVRNDIVQKVLLQDLPTLYGITDVPELNRLFTTVAHNTAQLVSLEGFAKTSGISKATIGRYLEFLEAAFLISRMRRVDESARRLRRERNFKVFLSNPSMRAALFGPADASSEAMGALAETALVTQLLHGPLFHDLRFAHWSRGEIDVVLMDPTTERPVWALEVKWSDTAHESHGAWRALVDFATQHDLDRVFMTSRTVEAAERRGPVQCVVVPIAELAYSMGRAVVRPDLLTRRFGLPFDLSRSALAHAALSRTRLDDTP